MAEAVTAVSSYASGTSVTLADVPRYRQTAQTLKTDFGNEYAGRDARRNPAPVDADTARAALAVATDAGNAIVAKLEKIQYAVERARFEGAVGPDQYVRQTRQAEVALLLADIDRLVSRSAVDGVNLLSSDSRSYRFQTTSVGGAVEVDPRPMDTAGFGLSGLTLVSNADNANALDAVTRALDVAKARVSELNNLGVNVSQAAGFLTQIIGENFDKRMILPRGSILDMLA